MAQPNDEYPQLVIRDPIGPTKTKGHPNIDTQARSEIDTSTENIKEKGLVSTMWSKAIFTPGAQNIRWLCTILEVTWDDTCIYDLGGVFSLVFTICRPF